MNTMRDVINLLNVAHDESKQFQTSVVKTFRTALAETRNVKRSAVATAKQHGIDLSDVAFIVREAKEEAEKDKDEEIDEDMSMPDMSSSSDMSSGSNGAPSSNFNDSM